MKKSTLFILLSAVTCMCLIQSIECSPLFFDLFKNIFGGNRNRPNNRPSYNNRPNNRPNNQWQNGGNTVGGQTINPGNTVITTVPPIVTAPAPNAGAGNLPRFPSNAVNIGGGAFSPAQQYYPASGLPTYFPTLPASDTTTPSPQLDQQQVK